MKIFLSIIFTVFCFNICAQSDLTVVAVGNAELEKERFVFLPESNSLSGDNSKIADELKTLLKNDFAFYKHKYDVMNGNTLKKSEWKEKSYRYVVSMEFSDDSGLSMEVKVYDVMKEDYIYNKKSIVEKKNVRNFGHQIADDIYFSINGVRSIFKSKIFFVSDKNTRQGAETVKEIYLMDFDGKRVQQITDRRSFIISPGVSPDNSKVLYTIIENKWIKNRFDNLVKIKNLNLYMLDLNLDKTFLISNRDGINSGAIFHQDGQNIYLTLSHTGNADIYKMNLNTKDVSRITTHYSDDVDPSINRDGNLLSFLSGRPGQAMIYTMDPSAPEKNVKRISFVGKFNATPRFAPNGKEIVFSSWVDERFDLYRINADGTNLVRLTKNFGSNEEPSYSPDGEFIVFTSQRVLSRYKAVQDVYIMNREGEIIGKITEDFGNCYSPKWSN
jgi:TolB protein